MTPPENLHIGHRERMRNKLFLHSARVFDTYEILEMILYYAIPGRDTNPISKSLLKRFGTIGGVLSADISELMEVPGVGRRTAELISLLGGYSELLLCGEDEEQTTLCDYREAGKFLVEYFEGLEGQDVPRTVMVSLDNRMRVISVDVMYELDFSSAGVRDRSFVELAMRKRAAAVILAHSHPFGAPIPHEGDRATNLYIASSLASCGIILAEHFIISGKRFVGFMTHLPTAFAQVPEVNSFIRSKTGGANES